MPHILEADSFVRFAEGQVQWILDLGCGVGNSWRSLGLSMGNCRIIGLDIQWSLVQSAQLKYGRRGWHYLRARGENIPLRTGSVQGVFCEVALPYMHIPRTLAEVHRVLIPGGWFKATLHHPSFTWWELRQAFPTPKKSLFRFFVLLNGMVLHFSGHVVSLRGIAESCQTSRGMRMALGHAGFTDVRFRHQGRRFFVDARREGSCASRISVPTDDSKGATAIKFTEDSSSRLPYGSMMELKMRLENGGSAEY